MNKIKTQLGVGDLQQYATMLVVIGIMLGIGSLILMTMYDTEQISPEETYNETLTSWSNNTYKALTYPRVTEILAIGNVTFTLGTGNYTFTATDKAYTNQSGSSVWMHYGAAAPNTGWNNSASPGYWVQYTYQTDSDSSNLLEQSYDAIGVVGDWLTIVAIVIVAVVVLALVKYL